VPFELFGQAWVLFRDAEGRPACVLDECAHRACPLSIGRVVEGTIECPYHGACPSAQQEKHRGLWDGVLCVGLLAVYRAGAQLRSLAAVRVHSNTCHPHHGTPQHSQIAAPLAQAIPCCQMLSHVA